MADEMIRNSTADFLMFAKDGEEQGIEVYVQDETVWLTQKAMATLFDTSVQNVVHHIKRVFEEKEIDEDSVIKYYFITASDGKKYSTKHYNLDAVISVGYRINSLRATQFRQWAKNYLSEEELRNLNEIVSMYLDYATRQAKKHIPMSMEDWAKRLDVFLEFNDEDVLQGKGKVTHAIAKAFAESEFEKYRVIQEREYQSDFDIMIQQLLAEEDC